MIEELARVVAAYYTAKLLLAGLTVMFAIATIPFVTWLPVSVHVVVTGFVPLSEFHLDFIVSCLHCACIWI